MPLYENLQAAGPVERLDTSALLIESMRGDTPGANDDYWILTQSVLANELSDMSDAATQYDEGEHSPRDSADLVRSVPRVRGFLQAIARVGETTEVTSAIDAGTGSSAILAVGMAVLHRNAEIHAVELNPKAALCASRIIELFNLQDRVSVTIGDALSVDLPDVTLGVTETFGPALLREPGVAISHRLAQKAAVILPGRAKIYAQDIPVSPEASDEWRLTTDLDLARPNEYVTGRLRTTGHGSRILNVHAGLYGEDNTPMVTNPNEIDADPITHPVTIGIIPDTPAGSLIQFQYRPSANLQRDPALIRQIA